ncbi:hypothetical protein GWI33_004124, partial [Rhynchophorus ferrugineus]
KEELVTETQAPYKSQIVPIFVITMLSIAGVIGLAAIVLKISGKRLIDEMDNISIASDLSTSSCSTVSEVEMCIEEKQPQNTNTKENK